MDINPSWNKIFEKHKENINKIILLYDNSTIKIYPSKDNIFKIFRMNIMDIKVVFLGQDPYHNEGQAHGLSFSVNKNMKIPPSLRNIYKELKNEFPDKKYNFEHGNLERWFMEEKIFLLNSSLTVIENKPLSHISLWRDFTNDIINYISLENKNCIFLLLGEYAKKQTKYIYNSNERCILGIHPSPLSSYRGFFNSNIFIKLNEKLNEEINWNL